MRSSTVVRDARGLDFWIGSAPHALHNERVHAPQIGFGEQVGQAAAQEGPFLVEERALLDFLAEMLAAYLEGQGAEAALRRAQALEKSVRSYDAMIVRALAAAIGTMGLWFVPFLTVVGYALIALAYLLLKRKLLTPAASPA